MRISYTSRLFQIRPFSSLVTKNASRLEIAPATPVYPMPSTSFDATGSIPSPSTIIALLLPLPSQSPHSLGIHNQVFHENITPNEATFCSHTCLAV